MQITLKLYASLGAYLPPQAQRNELPVDVAEGTSIKDLLDRYNVPRESCHLGVLNGVVQAPAVRAHIVLKAGDAVAVWPPVAGG